MYYIGMYYSGVTFVPRSYTRVLAEDVVIEPEESRLKMNSAAKRYGL